MALFDGSISERLKNDLGQALLLFSLPFIIWMVMAFAGNSGSIFNPVLGVAAGCFFGFTVDGVFSGSPRYRQILWADVTIGVILWGSLEAWLALSATMDEATVAQLTNPVVVIVIGLFCSRLTILIENAYYARLEERQTVDVALQSRVDELERRLSEDWDDHTGRFLQPDEAPVDLDARRRG